MKKTFILALFAALVAGCATSGTNTAPTTASNQTLTLEEALQKSAETRQKLEEAKQAYQQARQNTEAANGTASATDAVKNQVKQKVNEVKTQVNTEVQAWQDVLKN